MKTFYTLIFSLFSLTAFSQWTTMSTPPGLNGRYDDVFFINDTVGWAIHSTGKILKCTDGLTWQLVDSTGKYNRSVEFANAASGFCGSLDSSLYKTTDGGQSWTDIADLITPKPAGICGLSIPAPGIIYGCGIFAGPAFVVKSTDSGSSWASIDLSAYSSGLVDIYFINADTGFVSGKAQPSTDGGVILYTENGGLTWTVKHKTLYPGDIIWKLQTPDGIHYYGSIQANASAGNTRMVKSPDGGATWSTSMVSATYDYTQMIGFISADHGWTGGGTDQDFFETYDGGVTWSPASFGGGGFNRFFKVNDNLAFMTGQRIYRYQVDSIVGLSESQPFDEIHELVISPNPVEDVMTISLDLKTRTHCQLIIYDANGRTVRTVIDEKMNPFKKEFTVSLADLSPQTLYVVLHTNEGMISRTIVKR